MTIFLSLNYTETWGPLQHTNSEDKLNTMIHRYVKKGQTEKVHEETTIIRHNPKKKKCQIIKHTKSAAACKVT